MDCGVVALHQSSGISTIGITLTGHQVPTVILTGLLEDSNSKLIHPVTVLIKLSDKASLTLRLSVIVIMMEKGLTSLVKCRSVPPRPSIL